MRPLTRQLNAHNHNHNHELREYKLSSLARNFFANDCAPLIVYCFSLELDRDLNLFLFRVLYARYSRALQNDICIYGSPITTAHTHTHMPPYIVCELYCWIQCRNIIINIKIMWRQFNSCLLQRPCRTHRGTENKSQLRMCIAWNPHVCIKVTIYSSI